MNGHRERDSNVERAVAVFLDKKFYPQHVKEFKRYNDVDTQLKGLDVTFSYGELNNIKVDEKAATHYINKDIPTFAFELSFLRNGSEVTEGWLIDRNKITQYYLLMWINATRTWDLEPKDIIKIELLLIGRRKLLNFLGKHNYNVQQLKEKDRQIRNSEDSGAIDKSYGSPIYFFKTAHLIEKPVNIIVKKSALLEMAEFHMIVQ